MKKRRVLILSPHPDDEALGCGGTLRWHVEQGDKVQVIFLTSGEQGVRGQDSTETSRIRTEEAKAAAKVLGYQSLEFWHEPDGALKLTRPLLKRMKEKLGAWKPGLVYAPHPREMHPDHRTTARLIRRAIDETKSAAEVRLYEIWTPLQQIDHVQDISRQMDMKLAAIRAHRSQCAIMKFDESALALARYRGEMHSWPGGQYAEVFARL